MRLARVALTFVQATVPRYRTAFSKHEFTHSQLQAVLRVMRYEDWTIREAEVRISKHSELRSALQLKSVPDYTMLYRFLARLDPNDIDCALNEVVRRMPGKRQRRVTVGVDATGLAPGAASSYYIRRIEHFGQP